MIDKRIPFGFLGEWGKVYKLYNSDHLGLEYNISVSVNETFTGADEIIFKRSDNYLKLYINDTLKQTFTMPSGYKLKDYKFQVGATITLIEFQYSQNDIKYRINNGQWQSGNVVLNGQIIDPYYESRIHPIKFSYDMQKIAIGYQQSNYIDIGQDVQFKNVSNGQMETTQPVKNLAADSEMRQIMTGDATYEDGRYKCVVAVGDIIWYNEAYWVAEKITQSIVYYPNEQAVWTIGIKRIYEEILTGV